MRWSVLPRAIFTFSQSSSFFRVCSFDQVQVAQSLLPLKLRVNHARFINFQISIIVPRYCAAKNAFNCCSNERLQLLKTQSTNFDSSVFCPIVKPEVMKIRRSSLFVLFIVLLTVNLGEGKTKKNTKQLALQSKETNTVNFIRLLVLRLIFGVASSMGLGENLSGVLGGMFVPPGADYYDDYGGDDDYTGGLL